MTHTYALLSVSKGTYDEVRKLLTAAGYDHAFNDRGEIDMHGIALVSNGVKNNTLTAEEQRIMQEYLDTHCSICAKGGKPFKAEGIYWHTLDGGAPFRCTAPHG